MYLTYLVQLLKVLFHLTADIDPGGEHSSFFVGIKQVDTAIRHTSQVPTHPSGSNTPHQAALLTPN